MEDAIKASKSFTSRRMRHKKASVVEDKNMDVVGVGEGDNIDQVITT